MPTSVGREEVQSLARAGAQVINVLPRQEFEEQRIPGSKSIPIKELDERAPKELDRERAVITYCWDYQ